MDAQEFTRAVVAAIENAELARYFILPDGGLPAVTSHLQIDLNVEAVRADLASPGGLKASHAQRRMLMVLAALWRPRQADDLFGESLGNLAHAIMAMDRYNREILAALVESFPGWSDL
jgi:hypothetical protein